MQTKLYKVLVIGMICLIQCFSVLYGQHEPEGVVWPNDSVWQNTLPRVMITPQSIATQLPNEVDNIHFPYFPHDPLNPENPHFYDQGTSGTCVAASLVYYCYTYEFNWAMKDSANSWERIFAPNFIYNFGNNGIDLGIGVNITLGLLKGVGALNFTQWDSDNPLDYLRRVSGYDKYLFALHHKISSYYYSVLHNSESLDTLKHWLNDHGEGATVGGMAAFGIVWKLRAI